MKNNIKNFMISHNISISNDKINFYDNYERNVSKTFSFTYDNLVTQLKKIDFESIYIGKYNKAKSTEVENTEMPQIAYIFYNFLANNDRIPEPEELISEYIKKFCDLNNGLLTIKKDYVENSISFEKKFLAGRILRAYNSYIRELALLLQLNERSEDIKFSYDLKTDFYEGVDIIGVKGDKKVNIASFVGSNNSKSMKDIKNTTRHEYKGLNYDAIAYNFGPEKNTVLVGDCYLYSNKAINDFLVDINNLFSKEIKLEPKPVPKKEEKDSLTYCPFKDLTNLLEK